MYVYVDLMKGDLLSRVGASLPYRDAIDRRNVKETLDRSGEVLAIQPTMDNNVTAGATAEPDQDGDGLPDSFETHLRRDVKPHELRDDGYTLLEEYLASRTHKPILPATQPADLYTLPPTSKQTTTKTSRPPTPLYTLPPSVATTTTSLSLPPAASVVRATPSVGVASPPGALSSSNVDTDLLVPIIVVSVLVLGFIGLLLAVLFVRRRSAKTRRAPPPSIDVGTASSASHLPEMATAREFNTGTMEGSELYSQFKTDASGCT
jgi:hypothetical protein